jgi:hypothetical protein
MSRRFKTAAIAVFTAILGFSAAQSQAATIFTGGSAGGWNITVPKGISLVIDSTDGGVLKIEKFADFPSTEGLPITFMQAGAGADATIDFVNESITNSSGQNWTGFQYLLTNQSQSLGSAQATFQPPPGGIFVPPSDPSAGVVYTSFVYAPTNVSYAGTQPNGTTAKWGFGSDGDLIINANPSAAGTFAQTFDFKEQPLTGPMVPLPAASWQGLAGLLCLGMIAYGKKLKKNLA